MSTENKKPENPNAFPSERTEYTDIGGMDISSKVYMKGMTLRDYFAAKAMSSINGPSYYQGDNETYESVKSFAKRCYMIADAMLKERENEIYK